MSNAITTAPSETVLPLSTSPVNYNYTALLNRARDTFVSSLEGVTSGSMDTVARNGGLYESFLQQAFNILRATEYGEYINCVFSMFDLYHDSDGGGLVEYDYADMDATSDDDLDSLEYAMSSRYGYASRGWTEPDENGSEGSYAYMTRWACVPSDVVAAEVATRGHCFISFWVAVILTWSSYGGVHGSEGTTYSEKKRGVVYTQLPLYRRSGDTFQFRFFDQDEIKALLSEAGGALQKEDYGKAEKGTWYVEELVVNIDASRSNIVAVFDSHTVL